MGIATLSAYLAKHQVHQTENLVCNLIVIFETMDLGLECFPKSISQNPTSIEDHKKQ